MKKNHFFSLTKGVILLTAILSFSLSSCNKDEEEETASFDHPELLGDYTGSYSHNDFSSDNYTFTVTGVDENTVKITPEDSNGIEFEVSLSEMNNIFYNYNNDMGNTSFTNNEDVWVLNFSRTNEGNFNGIKQ